MKVSKVIGLLCTAVSGLNDTLGLCVGMESVEGKIVHNVEDDYSHVHSLLSPCSEVVRELWNELPESLRDEDTDKLVWKLYPHLYEDNYSEMQEKVRLVHGKIYTMWQTMRDAKDAADIYS